MQGLRARSWLSAPRFMGRSPHPALGFGSAKTRLTGGDRDCQAWPIGMLRGERRCRRPP